MKLFLLALSVFTFFSVSAQIPNGSFEDWDGLNPDSWTTNNNDTVVPPLSTVLVLKDTINPYHGKNAMSLGQNWAHTSWAETIFPNTSHPTSLTAFVKCYAYDTVSIRVETLSNGQVVDAGTWSVSDSIIDDWTRVIIPITQSAIEVFETRIFIHGGRVTGPADETSGLLVDSLTLGYAPLSVHDDELAQKEWSLYPNPTDGMVHILSKEGQLNFSATLYSNTGVKMLETTETSFDISHFPKGAYYIQLQTRERLITEKIVFE